MDSVYVSLFTGMRFGKVANLTWDKMDFEQSIIILEGSSTKSGKRRSVALHHEAQAALQRRLAFVEEHCRK